MTTSDFNTTIKDDYGVFLSKLKPELYKQVSGGVLKAAQIAAGHIRKTVPKKKGGLARSFRATLLKSKDDIRAGAISDLIYADVQDRGTHGALGGPIRPRTVKFLSIPLSDRAKRMAGLWPRNDSLPLFCFKGKSGKLFLANANSEPGKKDFLQYLLVESVTIKGSNYLERAQEMASKEIIEVVGKSVQSAIDRSEKESK